jgi:hypothetical protein
MPSLPAPVAAAMREDLAAWRADAGSGETDMDFETWLRSTRPQRYRVYLEGTGGRGS